MAVDLVSALQWVGLMIALGGIATYSIVKKSAAASLAYETMENEEESGDELPQVPTCRIAFSAASAPTSSNEGLVEKKAVLSG